MNSGYNPQNQGYNQGGYGTPDNPWGNASQNTVANASPEVRANFIRSTYLLFMSGILCSIVAGWLTLSSPVLLSLSYGLLRSSIVAFVVILGASIGAQAIARTPGLNFVGLYGFSGLMGFVLAPVLRFYEPALVGQAAFLSVLVFGALTAYALVSKSNFSFLGGMLFVGMIALIGAAAANLIFFKSSGFGYWLAWGSLFLSSGFVLYQTSNIVHEYQPRENVAAALGLFISFLNIFTSLLRILGGNSDD